MANWAITGSKNIWRNFNLANLNELACAPCRAVVGSENERWSTNDLYAVAVICVGVREYMRARTCSVRTYVQIITGENLICGFAIDHQIAKLKRSPNFPLYGTTTLRQVRVVKMEYHRTSLITSV